jgi:uncharacterized protein (TIGR03492 family)
MKKILFITNGHGEDIVAARIIKELKFKKIDIDVMPVIGAGDAFKDLGVNLIGPKKILPGGGFGLRNYSYLIKDLFSGLLGKVAEQIHTIKKNKWEYTLVIGIGDIVPIIYSMITGCRFIFVGVNKSEHYKGYAFNYTGLEKRLLRKYCMLTLARDRKTAEVLQRSGVNSTYVGNPMMDGVKSGIRGQGSGARKNKVIGFLPGTREDAYKNIEDFYKIARLINKIDKKIAFVLSVPETLDKRIINKIKAPVTVKLADDFRKVISTSDIIIGLSGTGNEQAAGLGRPVISFPGRGAQYNRKFASAQKELLGDALILLPRNSGVIAGKAISLLHDKAGIKRMSAAGMERMGKPGASKIIAAIIEAYLQSRT